MTHDYKRNGTTSLFAALSMLDGKVIGQCQSRHRHQEFLKFLRRLDREFPGDWELHLVLDNYGTHKTPEVQKWLKRHGRFVLQDRKSTRLNSSHGYISYAVFCLKQK